MDYTLFEIKVPRIQEVTPEAMATVFSSLAAYRPNFFLRMLGRIKPLFFEIAAYNQSIHFCAAVPEELSTYFQSQIIAQYPKASLTKIEDYLPGFADRGQYVAQLVLSNSYYFPLKTWRDSQDLDLLSAPLGVLSRIAPTQKLLVQIVAVPASRSWQNGGRRFLTNGIQNAEGNSVSHPKSSLVDRKLASGLGFNVGIRLLAQDETDEAAKQLLGNLAGSFGSFSLGESNNLVISRPHLIFKTRLRNAIFKRSRRPIPRSQILTTDELASLWHLPNEAISTIPTISWGGKLLGEPPENLPTALIEDKQEVNFFARTEFKGSPTVFGIKKDDRRRHMYLIGKTGSGKSTLIANMAINDMRNGQGVAVIDPHGDLSEIILDYVPSFRINDVVYLDAADKNFPFHLNLFEATSIEQRDLIASGVVAIFYKLYSYTWGPRLEYIFRNAILTLLYSPNSTLADVPRLLTDRGFRERILANVRDPILVNFWRKEFEGMGERLLSESIAPILNKVGQFVSSGIVRNIIGHPKSTINLAKIMNEGKILILNLSQGKLGEDNSSLLGAMFVTKMQLAAMERVSMPEGERRDFFLYVDEFQNFATSSFIKILSEARKYRLSLILANQYIAQVPEDVQKAILGNVGSLTSFVISAQDAHVLEREFGEVYKESELVSLDNFQVIVKMAINGKTTRPFSAYTLPLPKAKNQNREKIIKVSRERYTKQMEEEKSATSTSLSISSRKTTPEPKKPETKKESGVIFESNK